MVVGNDQKVIKKWSWEWSINFWISKSGRGNGQLIFWVVVGMIKK